MNDSVTSVVLPGVPGAAASAKASACPGTIACSRVRLATVEIVARTVGIAASLLGTKTSDLVKSTTVPSASSAMPWKGKSASCTRTQNEEVPGIWAGGAYG